MNSRDLILKKVGYIKELPTNCLAIGYCRISNKLDNSQTIPRQIESIQNVAKSHNNTLVDIVFDKKSGYDFNRKTWRGVKEIIKQRKDIKVLYVPDFSRLGRNTIEQGLEARELSTFGCIVCSVLEGFRDFNRNIMSALNEEQLRIITEKSREGQLKAFEQQRYFMVAPFGYYIKEITKSKDKEDIVIRKLLVPIEEELLFVKKLYTSKLQGLKDYSLCKIFHQEGQKLLQKRQKKGILKVRATFSRKFVRTILSNPIYIGWQRNIIRNKETKIETPVYMKLDYLKPLLSEEDFFKYNPSIKEHLQNEEYILSFTPIEV